MENYFNVQVKVSYPNGRQGQTTVKFFTQWTAVYMAKKYRECSDVMSVDVINELTGEVVYYYNDSEEWEAE